jgi:DNA-binding MarR family transcriptional regulator
MQETPLTPEELGPALAEVFLVLGPLYRITADIVARDEPIEQIPTGVRAVLERVAVDGPQTVPAVARAIETSRQFVQRMVNEAADRELVVLRDNERHRRSRLVALTPHGRSVIDRIVAREQAVLAGVGGDLTAGEVATCIDVLARVLEHLRNHRGRPADRPGPEARSGPADHPAR